MITYRYRVPFVPPRRAYLAAARSLLLLTLVAVIAVVGHPLFTATSLDPVRSGEVPGDSRAVVWVDEGLRYRIHVREGAPEPTSCSLATTSGAVYPLTLDRDLHGDPETVDGHRWFGAFRSPVDAAAALDCDRSADALRVHVDVPGTGRLLILLFAMPVVLIWTIVRLRRVRRDRVTMRAMVRPSDPTPVTSAAALAAGDRAQATVYFRNGTFVPAGRRDPQAAKEFATERLTAPRGPADFRTAPADDGGHLVTFPDLTVYLSPDEAKHAGVRDLGRHAIAKIGLDARDPDVTYIRPPEEVAAPV